MLPFRRTKYPLDLTGKSPLNRMTGEVHEINDGYDTVIVLDHGLYYVDNLVVRNHLTGSELTIESDYVPNYLHVGLTEKSDGQVNGILRLKDVNFRGKIEVDVNYVGSIYNTLQQVIVDKLTVYKGGHSAVSFNNLFDVPRELPPEIHQHVLDEIDGKGPIAEGLHNIAGALQGKHPEVLEQCISDLSRCVNNLGSIKRPNIDTRGLCKDDAVASMSIYPDVDSFLAHFLIWTENRQVSEWKVSGKIENDSLIASELRHLTGTPFQLGVRIRRHEGKLFFDFICTDNSLKRTIICKDFTTFESLAINEKFQWGLANTAGADLGIIGDNDGGGVNQPS